MTMCGCRHKCSCSLVNVKCLALKFKKILNDFLWPGVKIAVTVACRSDMALGIYFPPKIKKLGSNEYF